MVIIQRLYMLHRPAAKGGQPAQIGRKAVGECAELFDKTWMQIGLRK